MAAAEPHRMIHALEPHGTDVSTNGSAGAAGVVVVISPFAGFGRLAHIRRELLAIPGVRAARIAGYGCGEATFHVDLNPGATTTDIILPGTRITQASDASVSLGVASWTAT